ncbi:MAG: SBBP repeat-containing protein [Saprospiraceae bacterium]|nr:SBBP repeat-containing protein [Saprospiraceae bacterium]
MINMMNNTLNKLNPYSQSACATRIFPVLAPAFLKGIGMLLLLMVAGIPKSFAQDFLWAKSMGGTLTEIGLGNAVDGSGNVYTTGYFEGTADFDPGAGTANLTSAGSSDIFVSKLDANGNFLWAKSMGGTSFDAGYGIAVDGSGNVYTIGYFGGTVDFDPGAGTSNLTSAGIDDIYVSKLDANGNFLWIKSMGGSAADNGYSIALDGSGNVYTTGYFRVTVDFDPGAGTANLISAGSTDIFVSKLDANGNFLWAKSMGGGTGDDIGIEIAIDGSGNVYTTGYFAGTVDFDPGAGTANLTSAGSADIFVSKLDANGNFLWAKSMGGTSFDNGNCIAADGSGKVYSTGYFQGTADFDPGTGTANLTSAGDGDIFVSKLDANGNFLWAKSMGGSATDNSYGSAADGSGNVYTTGYFAGTVDFDPGAGTANLTSGGVQDIFVSKLDANGNFLWAKSMGGTASDIGYSIAVDGSDNVYTTGYFGGTVDFDPGAGTASLTSAGGLDIFVSKLGQDLVVCPTITAPSVTQPTCAIPTGTIVVNATGSGALEYSINNGSTWQSNNTYGGQAPGNYNIKVRLQANPTCEATYGSNPVVLNSPFTASTTTDIWTGCVSTNWATPGNWADGSVPTAADDATIPNVANDPVIMGSTAALARSVLVQAGAMLTINAMGSLTINNSAVHGLDNYGTVDNSGDIIVGNTTAFGNNNGVFQRSGALFSNNAGASLTINAAYIGILNAGTTNNTGTIVIGNISSLIHDGIQNGGIFNNNIGVLSISTVQGDLAVLTIAVRSPTQVASP